MWLFYVVTLTSELMTFNIGSKSAVAWPNQVPYFRKTKKSVVEFTESILRVGLSMNPLGELTVLSYATGQITHRRLNSALVASELKLYHITAPAAIQNLKKATWLRLGPLT